jgi:uncharacterized protein YkwD
MKKYVPFTITIVLYALALFLILIPKAKAYSPEEVLASVNKHRSTAATAPLVMNVELSKAAQDKAHMLISCGCFTHTPNGKRFFTHIEDHKIAYWNAGENLGLGFKDTDDLTKAWLASPTHKANMLGFYTQTGIAVMAGTYQGREAIYVVQLFIIPQ